MPETDFVLGDTVPVTDRTLFKSGLVSLIRRLAPRDAGGARFVFQDEGLPPLRRWALLREVLVTARMRRDARGGTRIDAGFVVFSYDDGDAPIYELRMSNSRLAHALAGGDPAEINIGNRWIRLTPQQKRATGVLLRRSRGGQIGLRDRPLKSRWTSHPIVGSLERGAATGSVAGGVAYASGVSVHAAYAAAESAAAAYVWSELGRELWQRAVARRRGRRS